MSREIVCIICPRSCKLRMNDDNKIEGYSCLRGKEYGEQEFVLPKRSFTSFVTARNGMVICVKTSKPIDKKLIFDLANLLKTIHPDTELKIGDILVKNVLNTDVDLVVIRS